MNRLQKSRRKRTYLIRYITKHPGVFFSDLQRHFKYSTGSLSYQLQHLVESEDIFGRFDGYWTRYYPISMRRKRKIVEFSPAQMKVIKILEEYPGSSYTEIAGRLRKTRQAIMYHLGILHKKGIVRRKQSGWKYLHYLNK